MLTLAIAEGYITNGLARARRSLLLVVIAFTYMSRLVIVARERTRAVREPLVGHPLEPRPHARRARPPRRAPLRRGRALRARHRRARAACPSRDQELAHTAGLLHDIGKFALSDRVMERGAQLNDADWRGIRRHPDIGADLLRDIGVFGPVGEIVRSHHERIDGRGYPRRPDGRGDPGGREDRRRRRGLRHADRAGHLPHADELVRGAERAAARRRARSSSAATSRCSPTCCPAAAPSTATRTRRTSTASSTWSAA